MDYPKIAELSAAAARKPFASLTNVVEDPLLLPLSQAWDGVQSGGGPATDAGQSQTTHTSDSSAVVSSGGINDANKDAQNDFSWPSIQALRADSASMGHTTGAADGRSVTSMGTLDDKSGEPAYGTANDHYVDHEVSNMAPWVDDNLNNLEKSKKLLTEPIGLDDKHT